MIALDNESKNELVLWSSGANEQIESLSVCLNTWIFTNSLGTQHIKTQLKVRQNVHTHLRSIQPILFWDNLVQPHTVSYHHEFVLQITESGLSHMFASWPTKLSSKQQPQSTHSMYSTPQLFILPCVLKQGTNVIFRRSHFIADIDALAVTPGGSRPRANPRTR